MAKKKTVKQEKIPEVTGEKPYKISFSRIFEKTHAAPGKTWLIVECKDKKRSYKKGFQILYNTPQEHIDEMAEKMYSILKKQFSL